MSDIARPEGLTRPRPTRTGPSSGSTGTPVKLPKMGRQPGLDGIRTFSVGMVALHHSEIVHIQIFGENSHHERITGGFVFPEMFFVMSGFLITTIMLQERESTGRFSLKGFYARRARRLLPGLWVMMAAAIVWATFFGSIALNGRDPQRYHLGELKWSSLFTLLMAQNWWMIFSGNGYFGGFPDLFRHIWSLSIDEQFYIFFPLLLVGLFGAGRRFDLRKLVRICIPIILIGWVLMAVYYRAPVAGDTFRVNLVYLSTFTRIPGILVGVVLACVWQPWRWPAAKRGHLPLLDLVGLGSFALIMFIGFTARNEAWYVYRGLFPLVSLLAAAVAATVVHPGAVYTRAFFGNKVVSGIGQRAFGIYLWHWPIFAGPLATKSYGTKLLIGIPATAVMAEISYRFIENPFRDRAIGKWRERVKAERDPLKRSLLVRPVAIAGVACLFLGGTLALRVATADKVSIETDGGVNDLDPGGEGLDADDTTVPDSSAVTANSDGTDSGSDDTDGTGTTAVAVPASSSDPGTTGTTVARTTKVRLAIVGSSQGRQLGRNMPKSALKTFDVTEGAKNGCTIFDDGSIEGHKRNEDGTKGKVFAWNFKKACSNYLESWEKAVDENNAEIALIVTGGWEVYDLIFPDKTLTFGSPEFDAYYLESLKRSTEAMKAHGAKVALLEVPCLRPIDAVGAGVPPLWERWQDDRTRHISDLFRQAAADDPQNVFFVENSDRWCTDPKVGENPAYRYDGVHVLGPGAKLIMDTITPRLLEIADS